MKKTEDKPQKKEKFKPESERYQKSKIRDSKNHMTTRNSKHQRFIYN